MRLLPDTGIKLDQKRPTQTEHLTAWLQFPYWQSRDKYQSETEMPLTFNIFGDLFDFLCSCSPFLYSGQLSH